MDGFLPMFSPHHPASAWRLKRQGRRFESSRPDLYYIYIIRSELLQRYYVGSTEDVERRLHEHNIGKSTSTRAGIPWELIHIESFATRSDAMLRERKIKARGIGRFLADVQPASPG